MAALTLPSVEMEKVTIDFGQNEYPSSLRLQPSDGKYVIGGYVGTGGQDDFALARVFCHSIQNFIKLGNVLRHISYKVIIANKNNIGA
jgi:hypothetical protein